MIISRHLRRSLQYDLRYFSTDTDHKVSTNVAKMELIDLKKRLDGTTDTIREGSKTKSAKYAPMAQKKFDILAKLDKNKEKTQTLSYKADRYVESLFFRQKEKADEEEQSDALTIRTSSQDLKSMNFVNLGQDEQRKLIFEDPNSLAMKTL